MLHSILWLYSPLIQRDMSYAERKYNIMRKNLMLKKKECNIKCMSIEKKYICASHDLIKNSIGRSHKKEFPLSFHTLAHLDHFCMTCHLLWIQFLTLQNMLSKYASLYSLPWAPHKPCRVGWKEAISFLWWGMIHFERFERINWGTCWHLQNVFENSG